MDLAAGLNIRFSELSMEKEEFVQFISQAQGMIREDDCFLLYSLVRELKIDGDILEIGSFKGRCSISFAQALKDAKQDGRVYSIEAGLFNTKKDLLENIQRFQVKDLVIPIFKHSAQASKDLKRPFRFIWIDNSGNFFTVKCDFLLWEPHLVEGGVFAFICSGSEDLEKVLASGVIDTKRFSKIKSSGRIIFAYKDKSGPTHPALKIIYARMLYTVYYLVKKISYIFYNIFPIQRKCSGLKRLTNVAFEKVVKIIKS